LSCKLIESADLSLIKQGISSKMLNEINFPSDLSYASDEDRKPLEFYLSCLRNSSQFDLRLGYFSSNAIRVLSLGFAQFIYNNGKVRIITNHYLS
jgi:hypothetical protein